MDTLRHLLAYNKKIGKEYRHKGISSNDIGPDVAMATELEATVFHTYTWQKNQLTRSAIERGRSSSL